ncbi:hypothetical protein [Methanobacterium aggregans]|uniref:hypothetical protein n=1 Tax=Methanobacterium aggregans TaxID=1615586 RepID=UPI00320EC135
MNQNIHKRFLLFIITSVFVLACCGSVSAANQPDLEIKNVTDSQYIGNAIYNNTTAQTKMGFANNTTAAVYNIKIQNNGNTMDGFNITATTTDASWTVKYFDALTGGNDITSNITGDGWIVSLASGASKEFMVEVTAPSDYTGYVNNVILTAVSVSNSTLTDSVVASTMAVLSSNETLPGLSYSDIGDIILDGNDDHTTGVITLPFNISYYGNTYNSLRVNNNGYVQFTMEYPDSTYQPAIPNNAGVMLITPFWNDIYTDNSNSGKLHCKITDDMAIFTWDHVMNIDEDPFYNTFQLILTKSGFVGFSYGDLQWANDSVTSSDPDGSLAGFNFGNSTSSVIFKQFNTTADINVVANKTFWFYMAGNAPVQVPAADITVSQSVDKTSANPGNKVTFTVTVKNNGPGTATNVQIRDVIPSELLNVVITPSAGTYNSATGIWSIGNMESGASAFLRITGTIKSNVNINNTASRIETGTYYDAVISNDLASSSVVVVQDPSNGVVNAAESVKTVPMQKTGVPLQYIVMAVLMVLGGVLVPRKK